LKLLAVTSEYNRKALDRRMFVWTCILCQRLWS